MPHRSDHLLALTRFEARLFRHRARDVRRAEHRPGVSISPIVKAYKDALVATQDDERIYWATERPGGGASLPRVLMVSKLGGDPVVLDRSDDKVADLVASARAVYWIRDSVSGADILSVAK